jgi:wyosine [tRNA(Phe)-imidazoG37] synthetase (radical SAM superfamily)
MDQYKTLFGPVPSRRLGLSLGIDFFSKKICSLACVYCEVGPTVQLTAKPDNFIPADTILSELEDFFSKGLNTDYLTICGSGEPTLSSELGYLISELKKRYPEKKVAVITNGTLLHLPEVIDGLLEADLIMPSLDAVSEDIFQKINKPDPDLNARVMIESTANLKSVFSGEIWLEILFIRGYNDHQEEIDKLVEAVKIIKPDRVQLNTLVRPGVLQNIEALSKIELDSIAAHFPKEYAAEVITPSDFKTEMLSDEQVATTIARRPCSLKDISGMTGSKESALAMLDNFRSKKILKEHEINSVNYYSIYRMTDLSVLKNQTN